MEAITPVVRTLEPAQIEQFITDGFVHIDHAFPRERADAARAILFDTAPARHRVGPTSRSGAALQAPRRHGTRPTPGKPPTSRWAPRAAGRRDDRHPPDTG